MKKDLSSGNHWIMYQDGLKASDYILKAKVHLPL